VTPHFVCPHCQREFSGVYWSVSGNAGGFGTVKKAGLAASNFIRHKEACQRSAMDNFNTTTFSAIPIGGRFVEVLSTCNEVATRIEPTTHRGKPVNARRSGGGLVFMVEWEPVLVRPHRIQRQRTRGWRMPPNTVYVGRPSGWGNPFTLIENSISHTREGIVQLYSEVLERNETDRAKWVNSHIHELRGKNLACWCRLDQPCHADVLLRLANK
jgi:hypothetical protein